MEEGGGRREMGLEGYGDADEGDGGDFFKGWRVGRLSEVSFVQEL